MAFMCFNRFLTPPFRSVAAGISLFGAVCLLAGCSPSLGPMYRDYEVTDSLTSSDIEARIVEALEAAGWEHTEGATENVVKTEDRTLNYRLLYKTSAFLEIVPIGDEYVRVLIHPYRNHLIGIRSKLPYLPSNVERRIVPPLTEALAERGLYVPGRAPDEDEDMAVTD